MYATTIYSSRNLCSQPLEYLQGTLSAQHLYYLIDSQEILGLALVFLRKIPQNRSHLLLLTLPITSMKLLKKCLPHQSENDCKFANRALKCKDKSKTDFFVQKKHFLCTLNIDLVSVFEKELFF